MRLSSFCQMLNSAFGGGIAHEQAFSRRHIALTGIALSKLNALRNARQYATVLPKQVRARRVLEGYPQHRLTLSVQLSSQRRRIMRGLF